MKKEKSIQLSTFTFQGQDFDVLVNKGEISYIFEINGKRYGNKLRPKSRSTRDLTDALLNLLINFMDTYAQIKGN